MKIFLCAHHGLQLLSVLYKNECNGFSGMDRETDICPCYENLRFRKVQLLLIGQRSDKCYNQRVYIDTYSSAVAI